MLAEVMAAGASDGRSGCVVIPERALDLLPLVVLWIDHQGRLTRMNPFAARLLAATPDALLGRDWIETLVAAESRATARTRMAPTSAERSDRPWNLPVRSQDGTIHHIEWYTLVASDVQTVLLGTDVTDRSRTAAILRESDARFQAYMDHCPAIAFMKDASGRLLYANATFERAFSLQRADWEGKLDHELWPPATARELRENDVAVLAGGRAVEFEETVLRDDGPHEWLSYKFPFCDAAGETFLAGMAVEITEHKRMERTLREREEQLRDAQKMEAIGTLASGIAHDFNNILGAILGFTQLTIPLVPAGGIAATNLSEILHASERAKALVQQILLCGRGNRPEERRHVSLGRVVQEALRLVRVSLPTTIELRAPVPDIECVVHADPAQLVQVILNLCTNATQATPSGHGLLELRIDEADLLAPRMLPSGLLPEGRYVRLSVRDTGEGMAPDVLRRIFEPFFTTRRRGRGTGLGLAVVHGIVVAHGGGLVVESHPGAGTTVEVWLPRATAVVAEEPAVHPQPAQQRGSGRILFVDDEPMLVRVGTRMLNAAGYDVEGCTSGAEALAAFDASPDAFSAVVTDQTMPGMTGDALARQLLRRRPDLPIILCTGFSERIGPEEASAIGIRSYLKKPIGQTDLTAALFAAVSQADGRDQ